jgi:hypothetical protein
MLMSVKYILCSDHLALFDVPNGGGTILFLHFMMETVPLSKTLFGKKNKR